jgi:hypothetical protein
MRLSGGCQCGAVRYRFTGEPGRAGICHCRMCQKAFGSWGAALVSLQAAGLEWTRGKPAEFRSSSIVARGFCGACGTPLYMRDDGDPTYDIAMGTLDDPNAMAPATQVGVESEVSWFKSLPGLPRRTTEDGANPDYLAKLATHQHPDHDTEHWAGHG